MTYTNIPKPSAGTYTNIPKPAGGQKTLRAGMTMGLLIPLTNAVDRTVGGGNYTNVAKPTGRAYTNIPKPI